MMNSSKKLYIPDEISKDIPMLSDLDSLGYDSESDFLADTVLHVRFHTAYNAKIGNLYNELDWYIAYQIPEIDSYYGFIKEHNVIYSNIIELKHLDYMNNIKPDSIRIQYDNGFRPITALQLIKQ